jgi:hypothetical protein
MFTAQSFLDSLEQGSFTYIGGYPLIYICSDGGVICPTCAKKERDLIVSAINDRDHSGWRVEACAINWEDQYCQCDHCGRTVSPAYPDESPLNSTHTTKES